MMYFSFPVPCFIFSPCKWVSFSCSIQLSSDVQWSVKFALLLFLIHRWFIPPSCILPCVSFPWLLSSQTFIFISQTASSSVELFLYLWVINYDWFDQPCSGGQYLQNKHWREFFIYNFNFWLPWIKNCQKCSLIIIRLSIPQNLHILSCSLVDEIPCLFFKLSFFIISLLLSHHWSSISI